MARRGVPDNVAEAVLSRFEELHLIDDEALAVQWVRSRHAGRGLGRRALVYELSRRGVDDETIRGAVAEIGPEQELAAACETARRRLAAMAEDDPSRRVRRLAGMLARKGYSPDTVMRAIREVTGEEPGEA